MQLGARWRAGDAPHRSVPESLHAAIAAAEAERPGAGSWTLTWLEGRPICTLDDVVTLQLAADEAIPDEEGDDDDWLS